MKRAYVVMDGYEDVDCVFLNEDAAKAYVAEKQAKTKRPWNWDYVSVDLHEVTTWPE